MPRVGAYCFSLCKQKAALLTKEFEGKYSIWIINLSNKLIINDIIMFLIVPK